MLRGKLQLLKAVVQRKKKVVLLAVLCIPLSIVPCVPCV